MTWIYLTLFKAFRISGERRLSKYRVAIKAPNALTRRTWIIGIEATSNSSTKPIFLWCSCADLLLFFAKYYYWTLFFSFISPYINKKAQPWVIRIQNQKKKVIKCHSNQWLTSVFKWGHSQLVSIIFNIFTGLTEFSFENCNWPWFITKSVFNYFKSARSS